MRDALEALAEKLWDGGWRIALLSAALGLLLWGWFAWTLSPLERHYFPAYVGSSLHLVNGEEPDRVAWLVKTRAKKDFEIAEPADVVPAAQGTVPFALSPKAVKEGWTGTSFLQSIGYPGGSQRLLLQENFFEGQSLGWLLFQPAEILAVPLALWMSFARWRYKRNQDRMQSWAEGEPGWAGDVAAFASELYGTIKCSVFSGWQAGRAASKKQQRSVNASSSVTIAPEKELELVSKPEPTRAMAVPSPKPKPVQASPEPAIELPRAQTLPFRKRQAAQSSERWDESKWID